jgi:hypothetical protein
MISGLGLTDRQGGDSTSSMICHKFVVIKLKLFFKQENSFADNLVVPDEKVDSIINFHLDGMDQRAVTFLQANCIALSLFNESTRFGGSRFFAVASTAGT